MALNLESEQVVVLFWWWYTIKQDDTVVQWKLSTNPVGYDLLGRVVMGLVIYW